MKKTIWNLFLLSFLIAGITSCKKDKSNPEPEIPTPVKIQEGTLTTAPMTEHYTLFSLKDGKEVAIEDSAAGNWDFGINFITIIVNSNSEGKGGVITRQGDFEDFATAPETGYAYDTSSTKLAIDSKTKSPDAWFLYNPTTHILSPKAGIFFVMKTSDGHYAKFEMLKSDYADWDNDPAHLPGKIVYQFRYVYQPDGSTNLK